MILKKRKARIKLGNKKVVKNIVVSRSSNPILWR